MFNIFTLCQGPDLSPVKKWNSRKILSHVIGSQTKLKQFWLGIISAKLSKQCYTHTPTLLDQTMKPDCLDNLDYGRENFTRIYTWEFAISPEFTRENSQFHTKKIFMPLMLINSWEKNTCEMNFRRVEIVSHCPNNRAKVCT